MPASTLLSSAAEAAIEVLFRSQSVKINLIEGFRLQIHDRHPDAPLSPFYINIRSLGMKGGTLTKADFHTLAAALSEVVTRDAISADRIAGIPAAGEPLVEALLALNNPQLASMKPLQLYKTAGRRFFASTDMQSENPLLPGESVLLGDDLITAAGTKLEAAAAITELSGEVHDVLVLLDRSADAAEKLLEHGLLLHAAFTFPQLLDYGRQNGFLSEVEYEAVQAYPERLASFVRAAG